MPLGAGEVFADFVIERLLGSGGMGDVYLAKHPRLPHECALKVLPSDLAADSDFRARFLREAHLASGLSHPNIVGVYGRGEFDAQLWIAMDYVAGIDAQRLLTEKYPAGMPASTVVGIVTAIAEALDDAHVQGWVHGDVTPANILVVDPDSAHPRALLADFGIARRYEDVGGLTATNVALGSLSYAAPEQLLGQPLDGRTDQYALAATTYQLLTGSRLFDNSNPAVTISDQLYAAPPRVSDQRSELGRLDAPMQIALAKTPDARYPRCLEFAHALRYALAAAPTQPTASPPATPQWATQQWLTPTTPQWSTPQWPTPTTPQWSTPQWSTPQWPTPATPQWSTRSVRSPGPAAIAIPLVLLFILFGAIGIAVGQVMRPPAAPSTAAPAWQPYVDFAKEFTGSLMSISAATVDDDIQRVIDGSTGTFHDEFVDTREELKQATIEANVSTKATVQAAGVQTVTATGADVLVAATTEVGKNDGQANAPRQWRLLLHIESVGNAYKVSKVEFLQ